VTEWLLLEQQKAFRASTQGFTIRPAVRRLRVLRLHDTWLWCEAVRYYNRRGRMFMQWRQAQEQVLVSLDKCLPGGCKQPRLPIVAEKHGLASTAPYFSAGHVLVRLLHCCFMSLDAMSQRSAGVVCAGVAFARQAAVRNSAPICW
jgi:hypothetical protein